MHAKSAKDILTIIREYGWISKVLKNCENVSYTIDEVIPSINNVTIKNDIIEILGYSKGQLSKNNTVSSD